MTYLHLIPQAETYGVTILAIFSLASFTIARRFHLSRGSGGHIDFVKVNLIVKSLIVLYGLLLIPMQNLFSLKFSTEFVACLAGIVLGIFYIRIEKKIIRYFARNEKTKNKQKQYMLKASKVHVIKARSLGLSNNNFFRRHNSLSNQQKNVFDYAELCKIKLMHLLLIAILEEIIFRGYLTYITLNISLNIYNEIIVLIFIAFLFAFSHASYSWPQIASKFIFGIMALFVFMCFGTLTSAISSHLYLNAIAYKHLQQNRKTFKPQAI